MRLAGPTPVVLGKLAAAGPHVLDRDRAGGTDPHAAERCGDVVEAGLLEVPKAPVDVVVIRVTDEIEHHVRAVVEGVVHVVVEERLALRKARLAAIPRGQDHLRRLGAVEPQRPVETAEAEQEARHAQDDGVDHEHHVALRERAVVVDRRELQRDFVEVMEAARGVDPVRT
jgi:hypothetical protein